MTDLALFGVAAWMAVTAQSTGRDGTQQPVPPSRLSVPFVVTQLPAPPPVSQDEAEEGMLRSEYGSQARLLLVRPDGTTRILSAGFHSACDPSVSFDGSHLVFAGKQKATDPWNIYEMACDGKGVRQITREAGNCRSPIYQSTLYTLVSPKPWYQIAFVSDVANASNESNTAPATSLYSCKLDGSALRRLTYNLSSDFDPYLMPDGRMLFASWQRARSSHGPFGRVMLFGINIDGTDFALYAKPSGSKIQHMPCVTSDNLVLFVESDSARWDGSGRLSCVSVRRPDYSYRRLTGTGAGLFHSPSPLPDGGLLVSCRPTDGTGTHALYRFDPRTKERKLLFDDPDRHEIQAQILQPRSEPDGRSSVVDESEPTGKLYCLNIYTSDLPAKWLPKGSVKRLRVLEGIPQPAGMLPGNPRPQRSTSPAKPPSPPPMAARRVLGDIAIEEDGSFHLQVPANTAIELQALDANGLALRSCGWIWAKNHEPRGCIGCHEDGELVPENWFVKAMSRPAIALTLPPQRRRTVDFRHDVAPILQERCVSCHQTKKSPLYLPDTAAPAKGPSPPRRSRRSYESLLAPAKTPAAHWVRGKYVHPGQARTSPLVWRLFGRNLSYPWDPKSDLQKVKRMPPPGANSLTEDERQTFVEWIDMGASWDTAPRSESPGGDR